MKRISFASVLVALVATTAMAQDNFPDVPENHWAYKDIARLKAEGLLKGFPDGLYQGSRPASRYELAVATHAAWSNVKTEVDDVKARVDDWLKRLEAPLTKPDLGNFRAAIEALTKAAKSTAKEVPSLRRLCKEFEAELIHLGADVELMKWDIASLEKRVKALEKAKPHLDLEAVMPVLSLEQ